MPLNKKQLEMLEGLANAFEERVLDADCAANKMGWTLYLTRVLHGWVPDSLRCHYWLDCYLQAVKELQKHGKKTTGVYIAEITESS